MASTLTSLLIHITFSTRYREPLIPDSVDIDLYAYVGGICRNMNSPLMAMGGTTDHVHMLVSLSKTVALSDLLLSVKRDSSKWMNDHTAIDFHWQAGYFGFSIGASGVPAAKRYIAHQKEHHRTMDFKDEVRNLLTQYGVEWDERYIWD